MGSIRNSQVFKVVIVFAVVVVGFLVGWQSVGVTGGAVTAVAVGTAGAIAAFSGTRCPVGRRG